MIKHYSHLRTVFVVLLILEYSLLTAITVAVSVYTKLHVEANADLKRAALYYMNVETYYLQLMYNNNASQSELAHVKSDVDFFAAEMDTFDTLERRHAFLLVAFHGAQAFTVLLANFLPFKLMAESCKRIIVAALGLKMSGASRLHKEALVSELAEVHCCFSAEFTECPDNISAGSSHLFPL